MKYYVTCLTGHAFVSIDVFPYLLCLGFVGSQYQLFINIGSLSIISLRLSETRNTEFSLVRHSWNDDIIII